MRILVVGCGSIGRRHAQNSAQLAEVAIVDTNAELIHKAAKELDVHIYDNLKSALDGWKPDGVIVATPTHTHVPIASQVIESGAHVLVEKPLSHNLEGVQSFLERAQHLDRKVFVACNMRFHPAVSLFKSNIHRLGRPFFARAHVGNYLPNMRPDTDYRSLYCANKDQGGGVILDAIHEVDYLMWLFGPVDNVNCEGGKLSDLEIDVEDYACICLRHKKGVISEIQMDYLRPFKRRGCELVGSQGILIWNSEGKLPEICTVRFFSKEDNSWTTLLETRELDSNKPYITLIDYFIREIDGREGPLLRGIDAFTELEVIYTAKKCLNLN